MDHDAEAKPAPQKRSGGSRRGDTRELGRVVRRYLGALEGSRSSRGKRRTLESFNGRLLKIDELLVSADPLARLHLTQERIDLHAELVRIGNAHDQDLSALEKDFVRVARQYGEASGITYAAWRQVGVDAEVLDQAGIVRTGPARPDASRVRRSPDTSAGTSEPLLPRPDPVLPLETPDIAAVPAAPEVRIPPLPPAPKATKATKAAKATATPPPAEAEAAEAAEDGNEAPKMRRKRIAD
jgi:hypothetical protein